MHKDTDSDVSNGTPTSTQPGADRYAAPSPNETDIAPLGEFTRLGALDLGSADEGHSHETDTPEEIEVADAFEEFRRSHGLGPWTIRAIVADTTEDDYSQMLDAIERGEYAPGIARPDDGHLPNAAHELESPAHASPVDAPQPPDVSPVDKQSTGRTPHADVVRYMYSLLPRDRDGAPLVPARDEQVIKGRSRSNPGRAARESDEAFGDMYCHALDARLDNVARALRRGSMVEARTALEHAAQVRKRLDRRIARVEDFPAGDLRAQRAAVDVRTARLHAAIGRDPEIARARVEREDVAASDLLASARRRLRRVSPAEKQDRLEERHADDTSAIRQALFNREATRCSGCGHADALPIDPVFADIAARMTLCEPRDTFTDCSSSSGNDSDRDTLVDRCVQGQDVKRSVLAKQFEPFLHIPVLGEFGDAEIGRRIATRLADCYASLQKFVDAAVSALSEETCTPPRRASALKTAQAREAELTSRLRRALCFGPGHEALNEVSREITRLGAVFKTASLAPHRRVASGVWAAVQEGFQGVQIAVHTLCRYVTALRPSVP